MRKMTIKNNTVDDKKEKLLKKLKSIQSKIDNIENQRVEKINKLAKKHKLFELTDDIIEQEFLLIKQKYAAAVSDGTTQDDIKKN